MPQLPLFPLGTVLMPGAPLSLRVFETRYLTLLRDLIADPDDVRPFGVVAIRAGVEVGPDQVRDLYEVGCTAVLDQLAPVDDQTYALVAVGERRFSLDAIDHTAGTPYLLGEVTWLDEPTGDPSVVDAHATQVRRRLESYWAALWVTDLELSDLDEDPQTLSYQVDQVMVLDVADRQQLLAAPTTEARLAMALRLLNRERELVSRLGTVPHRPERGPASLN